MQNLKDFFAGFSTFALENAAVAVIIATVLSVAPDTYSFAQLAYIWSILFTVSFLIVALIRLVKYAIEN